MRKLSELMKNPSGFDSLDNYAGEIPDDLWLVVLTRNRDSDILTESNWTCAIDQLGGESEGKVEIFRFGHWACGWWEALCVSKDSKEETKAREILKKLKNYPVLDESHYSEMESDEAQRIWKDCFDSRERLEYIKKNRDQFDFHNWKDLRAQIRGEYFGGYTSELIG